MDPFPRSTCVRTFKVKQNILRGFWRTSCDLKINTPLLQGLNCQLLKAAWVKWGGEGYLAQSRCSIRKHTHIHRHTHEHKSVLSFTSVQRYLCDCWQVTLPVLGFFIHGIGILLLISHLQLCRIAPPFTTLLAPPIGLSTEGSHRSSHPWLCDLQALFLPGVSV